LGMRNVAFELKITRRKIAGIWSGEAGYESMTAKTATKASWRRISGGV